MRLPNNNILCSVKKSILIYNETIQVSHVTSINVNHYPDIYVKLCLRLQRWPNVTSTLHQGCVFARLRPSQKRELADSCHVSCLRRMIG